MKFNVYANDECLASFDEEHEADDFVNAHGAFDLEVRKDLEDEQERLTEFLDDTERWICEYCTENTDYANGYDCLITEDPILYRDKVVEWVLNRYPHFSEDFAKRVWENIDDFEYFLKGLELQFALFLVLMLSNAQ